MLKKIKSVNITVVDDIHRYDFKKSDILSCLLDDEEMIILKYKPILFNVYNIINDGTKIIKTLY